MSDQDFRIIPERDEPRAGQRAGATSRPRTERSERSAESGERPAAGSGKRGGMAALLVGLAGLLLAGFLALQWQKQVALNGSLESRIVELEQKLDVTGESMSESGAALQAALRDHADQLELHMSEIRKLWDLSNKSNKPRIDANEAAIATLKKDLGTTTASIAAIREDAAAGKVAAETVSSRILAFSAQVDDLVRQTQTNAGAVTRLQSTTGALTARVDESEQAIRSIDAFRRETNEKILQLQRQSGTLSTGP